MEEMLNQAESSVAGLQKYLNKKRKLREKAEKLSSDFHKSLLSAQDTLENAKTAFEEEKAALFKHAEKAEEALGPVTEELAMLKDQIKDMCIAIFGNYKFLQVTK